MNTVLDAIEILKTYVAPTEEKFQQLRSAIDRHCEEKSQWRTRAEAAEKQVESVRGALRKLGPAPLQYEFDLGRQVESAILESRRQLERELADARGVTRSLKVADECLRHHAASLGHLYNKAAGNILFGHGEKPDLGELRMAINDAIEVAVQERVRALTGRAT
jgi:hypothetical protein